MKEIAVIERYIYSQLSPWQTTYGFPVLIAPFDIPGNQRREDGGYDIALPIAYYKLVSTSDRNAIGPGKRLMTSADYEIGIFSDTHSMGASWSTMKNPGGVVSLLDLLTQMDDIFQNLSQPLNITGGTIYSIERQYTVRLPERGGDGRIYKSNGGVYRFHVEAI